MNFKTIVIKYHSLTQKNIMTIKNHKIVLKDTGPGEMVRFRHFFLNIWRQQIEDDKNTAEMARFVKESYNTYEFNTNNTTKLGEITIKNDLYGTKYVNDTNKIDKISLKNDFNKHNEKELQDELELNMYDYSSRLYTPARANWSNIASLEEKFPDMSSSAFCVNNPDFFVDPDGIAPKPPKLSGIITVTNVMSGQKWINYNNDIVRTTSFLGFEINRTSKHEQCADYSRLQVEQGSNGNYTAGGSKNRIDMFVEKGGDKSKLDLQKGINTIIDNLKDGKAVMAGVMYNPDKETGNPNGATNHYITIVGMGTDYKGVYFSYYDNYSDGKGEKVGTDLEKNKFRLVKGSDGTYYFGDVDNNIPLNGNKNRPIDNKEGRPARYILTEVRDTD